MTDLVRTPITQLKPGSFVQDVTKQMGDSHVKHSGWVRTEKAVAQLKKMGILEVLVDTSKSLAKKPLSTSEIINDKPEHVDLGITLELDKAKEIFQEAKAIQQQSINNIQQGQPLDIADVEQVSDSIIDSIFRNSDALSYMIKIRESDDYLMEHSISCSVLMTLFAKHLALDKNTIHDLATGAMIHDIGKIKLSDELREKKGKLSEFEKAEAEQHVEFTRQILLETAGLSDISYRIAIEHHERLDGSGFPLGLTDESIDQYSRMMAIVDTYDKLTTNDRHTTGMGTIAAFRKMMEQTPAKFDADLLQQFIKCIGVYPVGTTVRLKSGKLGVIIKANEKRPIKPIVKVFYHTKHNHHIDLKEYDLSDNYINEEIDAVVNPDKYGLAIENYL